MEKGKIEINKYFKEKIIKYKSRKFLKILFELVYYKNDTSY